MSALREVFARFGVEFDGAPLERGNAQIETTIGSLRDLAQAAAGAWAVQQVRAFVSETVAMGDAIDDTSAALGISARELQEWQHVARLSGAEVGEFSSSFVRLQNRMAQGGEGVAVFRRLGVEIRNADGSLRNASDVLTDLADPIAAIGSDAERTGVLVDLLGRSGSRLGPLFERGSAGIAEVRGELATLGGGLSDQAIEDSAALADAWVRLDVVTLSFRSKIATLLLPALEWLSRGISTLTSNSSILDAVLIALGVASAQLAASTVATWGPIAVGAARTLLPLIALVLVVDDLITLFRGGRSVIGDVMDALGGEGTAAAFVQTMTEGWTRLLARLREVRDFWVEMFGGETSFGEQTAGGEVRAATSGPVSQTGGITAEEDLFRQIRDRNLFSGRSEADMRAEARDRLASFLPPAQRAPASAAPAVTQTVGQITVNTEGLSPTEARRMVEGAVSDALTREATDSLDTLAGGAVE